MLYMISPTSDDMMHYGVGHLHSKTGRGSGRYAWGSGKNPRAGRQIYGNSNGVTKQTIKKRNKDSGNKSGVDIQITTYKKNISTDRGLSKKYKFATKENVKVVNEISKDHINCALCTYAMDLRERGIDVQANTKNDWMSKGSNRNTTKDDIASWYKTKSGQPVEFADVPSFWNKDPKHPNSPVSGWFKPEFFKTGNDRKRRDAFIKSQMVKEGDGTYGHLSLEWAIVDKSSKNFGKSLGGHDVFYKIENGKVIVYDGQIGKSMPYDEYMMQNAADDVIGYPDGYLRTDNLELSKNSVSQDTVIETETPDKYNYSPSYKTVTKIKSINQYSPPYVSDNKEIIQYTPPYKTNAVKKVMDNSIKKVKDVSTSTTNRITKVKDKIETAIKNIQNKITNTSPDSIIKRLKNK